MQGTLRVDQLKLSESRLARFRAKAWREWCFARSVIRTMRLRLLVLLVVLAVGAVAFRAFDKTHDVPFVESLHTTFGLLLGESPPSFPESPVLQVLLFLIPLAGLTIIIEAIVELASMVRDRRLNEREWCEIMAASLHDHIVLVGLGRLGFRTFRLLRRLGEKVVVIECDERNQFLEAIRRDGSPLFIGDARREAYLEEANVAKAKAIILGTTDDLANLEIALDARRMNPRVRVVLRMFDQNMADKIRDGFNIHIAMSQSAISAPAFATAALDRRVVSSTVIENELLVMVRWRVSKGGPLDGKSVQELVNEMGINVVRATPPTSPESSVRFFPKTDTVFAPGDELLVQGAYERIQALREVEADWPPAG